MNRIGIAVRTAIITATLTTGTAAFAQGLSSDKGAGRLEEVIVTAQRREMTLLETPISITAIDQQEMARRSLVSLSDYLNAVPGVTASPSAGGTLNDLTFRGLGGFSGADATVGVYLGEVPLTSPQYAIFASDVRLIDMARVEVLRGPNGSLYGSSSLSGTLRYIPNAPDLSGGSGSVNVGRSITARGGDDGYKVSGVLNVPLVEDRLGLRVSAYKIHEGGVYDNIASQVPIALEYTELYGGPLADRENMGGLDMEGFRAILLWEPGTNWRATLMYVYQDVLQDGAGRSWPTLGSYKTVEWPVPIEFSSSGWPFYRDTVNLANLFLEFDLGWADLSSSTSWYDGGFNRANALTPPRGLGKLGQVKRDITPRESFFEEIRLTSKFDGPLQFSAGYFYQDSKDDDDYNFLWMGGRDEFPEEGLRVFTGQTVFNVDGTLVYWENSSELEQHALFGEVYYDLTDALTLTLGGRYFDYDKVKGSGAVHDPMGPVDEATQLNFDTSNEDGTVFRANLKYDLSDSGMVYAEWGEGFRVGRPGSNPTSGASCDADNDGILDGTNARLDQDITSDRTESTEVGAKFRLLDNRFIVNAAIYSIDWTNLPTKVFSPVPGCVSSVTLNTGDARSRGIEIETQTFLTENLRLDLGGSVIDAELVEDDPSIGALAGDPLPRASDVSWKAGLEYEFEIAGYPGYVGGEYYYVSGYWGDITRRGEMLGDFNMLDFHLGMQFDAYRVQLYGSNLTNEDAYTSIASEGGSQLRPRIIGVDLTYDFDF